MLLEAGSGHSAGPLGMADVFTALYFSILKHNPKDPEWDERDRLFLSNGHICPVRYATMAHAGYFPREELKTLRKLGTRLQGHPERLRLAAVWRKPRDMRMLLGSPLRLWLRRGRRCYSGECFVFVLTGNMTKGITGKLLCLLGNTNFQTLL